MAELVIYREGGEHATVHIGESVRRQWKLMGENKIVAPFSHPTALNFDLGDYIMHRGQQWRLNTPPSETKVARNRYEYELVFEGREYTWHNKQVMHLGMTDFSFFGTAREVLQLIVDNINEIDPVWALGFIEETEPRHFEFSNQSCAQALSSSVESVGLEYNFEGTSLTVRQSIGDILEGIVLSYGKGNGLYSLTRQPVSDGNVATRVYGYGSVENIPAGYRGGMQRLTFAERKVENNIDIYGIIETAVIFDDIRPERTGDVTATSNATSVTDSTLDFDLNSVIIDGQAKIVFKTGALAGNEFEIASYDHGTKNIKFLPNQEESGYVLPNETVKPSVGDQYTLVGIFMPQSYIDAAEAKLKTRTQEYAESVKHPALAYSLDIDVLQARAKGLDVNLNIGDKIRATDAEMNIDVILRAQSISYPLINEAKISATINDKATYSVSERIRKEIASHGSEIREISKRSSELQRTNAIRRKELQSLIFDPDGYFDADNIRPLSIETTHIAVGSRSQEFSLSVIFRPNYNGDPNSIMWTSGALTHFTIADNIRVWNIATGVRSGLTAGTAYYIYARCSRSSNEGTIVFDTEQRKIDSDADYYYFLIGVLSSVIDGIRWPTLTYGTTEINGGFIRTGRIVSNDGNTWFDLNTGEFRGIFRFRTGETIEEAIDNIVTNPKFITLTGDQTFVYGSDLNKTVDKEVITISASEHNFTGEPGDRLWEYYNGVAWAPIPNTFNTLTYDLRHDAAIWNGGDSVSIRYRVGELVDQMTIVKLYSGESDFKVVIRSTYGDHFFNGNIDTTLSAEVYWGGERITDTVDETAFTWTRVSNNPAEDEIWNFHEGKARKTVEIDHTDVYKKAVFDCEVEINQ